MLEIEDLCKAYKVNHSVFEAVRHINMTIEAHDIVGFLGSNGAGKTTTIKMICNLITPTSGRVLFEGKDVSKYKSIAQKNIGVMLEGARNLYHFLTVEENVKYFSYLNKLKGEETEQLFEEMLDVFDMRDKRNETVNKLSRGMQQKVAIMVAILKNPKLLILDEPTLGLDVASKIKMRDFLIDLCKKRNKALIICTHEIELAEKICNKVAVFHRGELVRFDETSQFKFSQGGQLYKLVVKDSLEIRGILEKYGRAYTLANGVVEFEMEDLDEVLKGIPSRDIFQIENIANSLESIIRGLQ